MTALDAFHAYLVLHGIAAIFVSALNLNAYWSVLDGGAYSVLSRRALLFCVFGEGLFPWVTFTKVWTREGREWLRNLNRRTGGYCPSAESSFPDDAVEEYDRAELDGAIDLSLQNSDLQKRHEASIEFMTELASHLEKSREFVETLLTNYESRWQTRVDADSVEFMSGVRARLNWHEKTDFYLPAPEKVVDEYGGELSVADNQGFRAGWLAVSELLAVKRDLRVAIESLAGVLKTAERTVTK